MRPGVPPDAPPAHGRMLAMRKSGRPCEWGNDFAAVISWVGTQGARTSHVRASGYPCALTGWLLMVGLSWVVQYTTPPVLLHVTLSAKNLCGWGAFT